MGARQRRAGLDRRGEAALHGVHQHRQPVDLGDDTRLRLGVMEAAGHQRAQSMRAARQHQRQAGQRGHRHAFAVGHAGEGAHADHEQPFVEQRLHGPALRGFVVEQHRQIDLARVQHCGQIARQAFDHAQPHVGVALGHRAHEGQAEHAGGGRRQPDADMAGQARMPRGLGGVVDMPQRQLRLAPEGQAGIGGQHAAGGPLQQPRRQLALEPADLLAQRRGDDAQFERRLAHAAVLHHGDEVAQLSEFHAGSAVVLFKGRMVAKMPINPTGG